METRLKIIADKLQLLKEKDEHLKLFGAQKHQYKLFPPLNELNIITFENKFEIRLPTGYRNFLLHIGNGGAGPYYGLESLENSLYEDLNTRDPNSLIQPGKIFPLTEPWNLNFENDAEEIDFDQRENEYLDEKFTYGLLRLADFGCGATANLVVNGDDYGKVWIDDRCNDEGLYPDHYFGNTDAIEFLDWYEMWLDQSLLEN